VNSDAAGGRIDPLLSASDPAAYWTITNLTEAFPGVLTPLGWSIIGTACELGNRSAFRSVGALESSEAGMPDRVEDRAYGCFYGRAAIRVDWLARVADRIPGADGRLVTEQFMGCVPPVVQGLSPYRRRYPIVAARYPVVLASVPRMVRNSRIRAERVWVEELKRTPVLDLAGARAQLAAGVALVVDAVGVDATKLLAGVQPFYEALVKLAANAGVDPAPLESGHGSHEETALVGDLWAASRGALDLDTVVARHGFHGPREGEVSSTVWREDPEPLRRICAGYRSMPDDADPVAAECRRRDARRRAELELVQSLPATKRPAAKLLLRLAHTYLPLRGKAARLQGLDIARGAARRLGELLELEGLIADRDDIFYLTVPETQQLPRGIRDLVSWRREQWHAHHDVDVPLHWEGMPTPIRINREPATLSVDQIGGVGAGAGVVEGRVCVVSDPDFSDDMNVGDVLVARTTDPSWASVMFMASALVVDIGGVLSHAAVVARELGLPCVMGTKVGTSLLRTGDVVRVDGNTGDIRLLSRVPTDVAT
jgi:phosphohistidine swiveling domain-containing protein